MTYFSAPMALQEPRGGSDLDRAIHCYRDQHWFVRGFVRGRRLLCPMDKLAPHVPRDARVLDIGCGHGLFVNTLASGSSTRRIVGVDPSDHKIDVARQSSRQFANVSYIHGIVQEINEPASFDVVSILDVLYLMPDEIATSVLWHCRRLLKDDGRLLLKTNDRRPRWKYALVWLEETLMVKVIGFTFGSQIHFRSADQYRKLLDEAGFVVEDFQKIDGWRPVPHRLFICRPAPVPTR
jgi:2-polyprenyl-3-methyl-5-hydroxy-6-metoxy-1,4-benzoquinol methylase